MASKKKKKTSSNSRGTSVTLKSGKVLTGKDAENYGKSSSSQKNDIRENEAKATKKGGLSLDALIAAQEFKALPSDQQEVVKAVYAAIGENNVESAQRLVSAFKAAESLAGPFFKQQIRLASDAVERGFVQIDKELEFSEAQATRRLQDLQQDITSLGETLTIDEQNSLKGIEREYKQTLDTTRQSLAATGRTFSSVRAETEQLIEESTGDLRESTKRSFGQKRTDAENTLMRGRRDTQAEIERLKEVANQNKTGLFRKAEEELGTGGLGALNLPGVGDYRPLGNIIGGINERKQTDIIGAVKNLVF